MQVPSGVQGTGDVVAAVDEDGGDVSDPVHVRRELVVGEEAAVAPVVSDEPGEHLLKLPVLQAQIRLPARRQRDVGVLPGAPLAAARSVI